MKKILLILILSSLSLCSFANQERENLAKETLLSLKNNNYEQYANSTLISLDEMTDLFIYFSKIANERGDENPFALKNKSESEIREKMKTELEKFSTRAKAAWTNLRKSGEEMGIDWNKVEYISSDFEREPKSTRGPNIKGAHIIVNFKSNNDLYKYQINKCLFLLNKQWRCSKVKSLKKAPSSTK